MKQSWEDKWWRSRSRDYKRFQVIWRVRLNGCALEWMWWVLPSWCYIRCCRWRMSYQPGRGHLSRGSVAAGWAIPAGLHICPVWQTKSSRYRCSPWSTRPTPRCTRSPVRRNVDSIRWIQFRLLRTVFYLFRFTHLVTIFILFVYWIVSLLLNNFQKSIILLGNIIWEWRDAIKCNGT